jgi:hypothetical protein
VQGSLRLDTIRNLGLEAVPDRDLFSRITLLASTMLGAPIVLLSVVEQERQWFLGRTGTDLRETPIEESFCAVCIQADTPLLIPDAREDSRLADNALVTGQPFIRSYLGVPIRTDEGLLLGALCAISSEPGAFGEDQIAPLEMLAEMAEQSIALHTRTRALSLANAALHESTRIFRQAERAVNVGSWRVDLATDRLQWSTQVYMITGLEPGRSVSLPDVVEMYQPEDRAMVSKALRDTIDLGKPLMFETGSLSATTWAVRPSRTSPWFPKSRSPRSARMPRSRAPATSAAASPRAWAR